MWLRTSSAYIASVVLVGFLNDVSSEYSSQHDNGTIDTSPWESGRTKRSPSDLMPNILKIKVMLEPGVEMELIWTKTEQYLANEHLPVMTLLTDVNLNMLHNFGDFVMYQDVKKCSAVVYFKKSKSLYGVIRRNYFIRNLPYAFNHQGEYLLGVVGEPYVRKRVHEPLHIPMDLPFPTSTDNLDIEDNRPSTSNSDRSSKRKIECSKGPSAKHQRTDQNLGEALSDDGTNPTRDVITGTGKIIPKRDSNQFYLETLIFVSRDIVELFKQHAGQDGYIHTIIGYYITYFNAVDMILKQMGIKPQLYFNIAKIVIEDELWLPFDFLSKDHVQYSDIIEKLPQYLKTNRQWYPPDSFDYVFIHTRNSILNDYPHMNGLTKHGENMYEARKNDRFYDAVPVTVVQYRNNYADYITTVHEIGQILSLKMDPQKLKRGSSKYCYNIMQKGGPKCDNCLVWDIQSRKQYKIFLRENVYRCFLLNSPRSLQPPGPRRFVTPHKQCQCFGYDSHILYDTGLPQRNVKIYGCNEPLQCQKGLGSQSKVELTVWPFDGTLCGDSKVCWNQQCVPFEK